MKSLYLPDRLNAALGRLTASLGQLEGAVQRRQEVEAGRGDVEAEFLALQEDRSRLAVQLDSALARSRALMAANDEVSARLDRATTTVTALLAKLERDDGQAPAFLIDGSEAQDAPLARRAGGRSD